MNLRHSEVTVDLDAIRHNYSVLKQTAPQSRAIAVIKANAYGHGAVAVAQALSEGSVIADAFAVATVAEAVQLRQASIKQKIVVFGGFINSQELDLLNKNQLDSVVHSQFQIDLLLSGDFQALNIWLKVNSGMGRLGFNIAQVPNVLGQLSDYKNITMMSHLASADNLVADKTQQQMAVIKSLGLDHYDWSLANSAGTLGWQESHHQWVRLGIALYGISPFEAKSKLTPKLKPAMHFSSQIIALFHRKKGENIGYGASYTCSKDMLIGIVGVGYADGYPRHIGQDGYVLINSKPAAIIGRVSMDMLAVDLNEFAELEIGQQVILWGENPSTAKIAHSSETIAYELCCHVGTHHKIDYLNANKV